MGKKEKESLVLSCMHAADEPAVATLLATGFGSRPWLKHRYDLLKSIPTEFDWKL
jgi:hypothetical protein